MPIKTLILAWTLLLFISSDILAQGVIPYYGNLPKVRSLALSPNGELTALIQQENGRDVFLILPTGSGKATAATELGDIQAENVYFISDHKVILTVSDTRTIRGYTGELNFSASYVYDIPSGKMNVLLNKTWGVHPAQGGLGRIIGYNVKKNRVYMPAFSGSPYVTYNLFSVDLETGKGKVIATGNEHTRDWFVDANGNVIAREDYHQKRQSHRVVSFDGNQQKTIFSEDVPEPKLYIYGKHPNRNSLVYIEGAKFYELGLGDGVRKELDIGSGESDVRGVTLTLNREIVAIEYDGMRPFSQLVNPKHNEHFAKLDATFPNSRVSYLDTINGGDEILALVSGNDSSGSYMLFDTRKVQIRELARKYPGIPKSAIGEISTIAYRASDDLSIPSLLTWPSNVPKTERKNLSLLVFPHGGPEANNVLGFDWWAQYFASQGYLVFQPNFRGSSGFGEEHISAGFGEWGEKMQSDLSDGLNALVKAGYADPKRVCIMGGSYGGYSALAGGAFTPDLYRCVVSVSGVSDVSRMLFDDKMSLGGDHFLVRYWEKSLGGDDLNKEKLGDISPLNYAADFKAPVLLVHGKSDTVVPFKQSLLMHRALKNANKDSTLIELKDEDHWLSKSATRLQMLEEIDAFLKMHNPPN